MPPCYDHSCYALNYSKCFRSLVSFWCFFVCFVLFLLSLLTERNAFLLWWLLFNNHVISRNTRRRCKIIKRRPSRVEPTWNNKTTTTWTKRTRCKSHGHLRQARKPASSGCKAVRFALTPVAHCPQELGKTISLASGHTGDVHRRRHGEWEKF